MAVTITIFKQTNITSQASSVYQLLLNNQEMTAEQISQKLDILPQAVYRAVKPLIYYSLIDRIGRYPVRFRVRMPLEAVDRYLFRERARFIDNFFPRRFASSRQETEVSQEPRLDFISHREEMLRLFTRDINGAFSEADLLVSGFELPAETILAVQRAIERGVAVRVLVPRSSPPDQEMMENWSKIGMKIHRYSAFRVRLIVIDRRISYVVSYRPKEKTEAVGVRFASPSVAALIREIFLSKWNSS